MFQVGYSDGTNHKMKSGQVGYTDGTNHKIKLIEFGGADGANHTIFKDAITWTYTATGSSEGASARVGTDYSAAISAPVETTGETITNGTVIFTFTEPFIMKSGDTIKLSGEAGTLIYGDAECYLNDSTSDILEWYKFSTGPQDTKSYTVTENTTINSIKIYLYAKNNTDYSNRHIEATVTLTTDGKTFILNNSNTSENQ